MNAVNTSSSPSTGSTSSGLLERAKSREPDAWQRLSALYGPLVYSWGRAAGLQECDAADVTQEVFSAMAANLDRFRRDRPSDTFRGWLWTITRNKIRDHYRAIAARGEVTGGSAARFQLEHLPDSPDALYESAEESASQIRQQTLEMVRAEFEDRTWQAFWRVALRRDKPRDVAEDLDMSVGAVYNAKSRVLRRLRLELEGLT